MNLTPSTVHLDKKCGASGIPDRAKCTKGVKASNTSAISKGLEKGTTEQLVSHRNALYDVLAKRFGKNINNNEVLQEFDRWATKQPEQQEINEVNRLLQKRWKDRARGDAFIGNKKLNCGPNSKPCGNACIPKDHKCRASWNKPVKAAAALGAAAGVGLVATAFLHKREGMRSAARASLEPLAQAGFAAGNAARGNWTGAAKNVANVAMTGRDLPKNLKTVAQGYGTDIKNLVNRGRNAAFKARHHRQAKGGRMPGLNYDSIWAFGFEP